MKNSILFFLCAVTMVTAQDPVYHDVNINLETGKKYALFGNDVKFRKSPDVNSKVLALLKIGSEVEILEKTTETIVYNGIDSPFYKVSFGGQIGYILGGLISLEQKQNNVLTYLFAYKKLEFQYQLLVRAVDSNDAFKEEVTTLGATGFSVQLIDNMGLEGIDAILHVQNHPEACGVVGSDIYFFQFGKEFKKAFQTTLFSEAGINWYNEKLIFPEEEDGVKNRIVFKKEQGEYGDEASNEIHIVTTSRELRWENGQLLQKMNDAR